MFMHVESQRMIAKKGIDQKNRYEGVFGLLPRLELFNCSPALLEEDAVTAVRAADVDVDLDFLFTPGTLIGTDYSRP
jgi:hypothetical protein